MRILAALGFLSVESSLIGAYADYLGYDQLFWGLAAAGFGGLVLLTLQKLEKVW